MHVRSAEPQDRPAPLRWGLLATGRIAGTFARGVAASRRGCVVAVGSRTAEAARRFAGEHQLAEARLHGAYEDLLADPRVEAVYVSTPHPMHAAWSIRAAQAGKHVLCEKPMAMSRSEGEAMVAAARQAGVILMEAFMYRCHPQTARIVELIRGGALGEVRLVQAAFGFRSEYHPGSRLWSRELGGGGIRDVGCYPVSMARLVAGAAAGKPFEDPIEVRGSGVCHPESGVDMVAAATLRFPSGLIAQVASSVAVAQENVVRIYGTEGWLLVPSPWVVNRDGGIAELHRYRDGRMETLRVEAGPLYALEADAFAEAVRAGKPEVACMTNADSLGNLDALDRWLEACG